MKRALLALLLLPLLSACEGGRDTGTPTLGLQGNPARGQRLIRQYNCGSCHTIPGVYGAHGEVAPPLYWFSRRSFIAGELPNTPANLQRWLLDPPAVEPGTAMPRLGLKPDEARDIAAYLSTLR
ncbi:MAG TPA: c-type cytochrome [Frateuria sp.]|uniref:c-type cytochrome n=1 Tax=Frateuria sp. TaxID=2211372 RepID=UPI002D80137A|nr:c-type cytochrome [Frateuria sp.]HET6805114.1 c-type cytochrome [Frateuria sp.]